MKTLPITNFLKLILGVFTPPAACQGQQVRQGFVQILGSIVVAISRCMHGTHDLNMLCAIPCCCCCSQPPSALLLSTPT